ncbi:MAG: hypothetical protein M1831_006452 [Alyxoria varia]|nr:MAG: hypothetical protein M1831_006452 [Alyxoria varia]
MASLLLKAGLFVAACSALSVDLSKSLVKRADPPTNYDISWYAALGDSYHAGPGAGKQEDGSGGCYRFLQAVGPQIDGDARFTKSTPLARHFQNLACTADKIENMQPQIDALDVKNDAGTMTIGGNDVYFGSIVNACIYQIYPSTWNCQQNKDAAREHMKSDGFKDDLKNTYNKILDKVPLINLHVLGYPRFFNKDSEYCSKTCFQFGVWSCADETKLTKEHREDMNNLVLELNDVIREVVGRASPHERGSIQYIDTDPFFEDHRFCEEGVQEPDYNNPDCWFYHFTWTRRNFLQSLGDDMPEDCPEKNERGDYGERYDCDLLARKKEDPEWWDSFLGNDTSAWAADSDEDPSTLSTKLPEWAVRMFHPTINGHGAFRDAVLEAYRGEGAEGAGGAGGANSVSPSPTPEPTPSEEPNCEPNVTREDGAVALGSCKSLDVPTPPPTSTQAAATPTVTVNADGPDVKCDMDDADSCKGVACSLIGATARCAKGDDDPEAYCLCTAAIGKE